MASQISDLVLDELASKIGAVWVETWADLASLPVQFLDVWRRYYIEEVILGNPAQLVVFVERLLDVPLGFVSRLAERVTTAPARAALALVLLYGRDQLFPSVGQSRVMTERDAATAMVHMIASAGMASGSLNVKGTSWVASAIALAERLGGSRSQVALIVGGQLTKWIGKRVAKRIEAAGYVILNAGLAFAFSVSCVFLVVWLLNDGWKVPKEFLLSQDNPRVWTSKRRRVREGEL